MIIGCVVCGIPLGWWCVVCGLVYLTSSGFSSGLLFSVGVFGLRFSLLVYACAWFGAFGVSTGEKNILTNVKECSCCFMTDIYFTFRLSTHKRDDSPQKSNTVLVDRNHITLS